MERDLGIYTPTDREHAPHHFKGQIETASYWYHDAIFDNGYNLAGTWIITESSARVLLQICDPAGKMTQMYRAFDLSEAKIPPEAMDIAMPDNHYSGKFPRYEMHFRGGDTGADLVYECLTMAVKEPPNGIFIGREQAPATPRFFGHIFRPRCKVSGKLIVAGREIPVNGEGAANKSWGTTPMNLSEVFHHWYWGKVYLPGHSVSWWDGMLTDCLGLQRVDWLWVWKGDKLLDYCRNANMWVESADLAVDPVSGVTYPRKVKLIIDEDNIKGTATYRPRHVIMRPNTRPAPRASGLRKFEMCYFRYMSDVEVKLNIGGEKIETSTQAIHEFSI